MAETNLFEVLDTIGEKIDDKSYYLEKLDEAYSLLKPLDKYNKTPKKRVNYEKFPFQTFREYSEGKKRFSAYIGYALRFPFILLSCILFAIFYHVFWLPFEFLYKLISNRISAVIAKKTEKKLDCLLEWLHGKAPESDKKEFYRSVKENPELISEYKGNLRQSLFTVNYKERSHEELMETNPYYRQKFQDNFRNLTGRPHESEVHDKKIQEETDALMTALGDRIHK